MKAHLSGPTSEWAYRGNKTLWRSLPAYLHPHSLDWTSPADPSARTGHPVSYGTWTNTQIMWRQTQALPWWLSFLAISLFNCIDGLSPLYQHFVEVIAHQRAVSPAHLALNMRYYEWCCRSSEAERHVLATCQGVTQV